MKVLIAPNAFKGTIAADRAATLIQQALDASLHDFTAISCPIGDGGDGTCRLLAKQLKLSRMMASVLNPIGRVVSGSVFLNKSQDAAFLDISDASGLKQLLPFQKDIGVASSFGTGQLISLAEEKGVTKVVLGLGGSASVDMGTGILSALGFQFLDQNGRGISMFSPGFLSKIAHIQSPIRKSNLVFTCLCDVDNYFFGDQGAVRVFGHQKGLAEERIPEFETSTRRFFELLQKKSKSKFMDQKGFGAAGGIALGLSAFFPVEVVPGARFFFDQVQMEHKIQQVDWVITGEGRFDSQSAGGKGPFELLRLAKKYQKKTVLITSGDEGKESGFDELIQLPDLDEERNDFKQYAERNLYQAVKDHFTDYKSTES